MHRNVIFLLTLFSSSTLQAQAFGVTMGDPVSKYDGVRVGSSPYQYQIQAPLKNDEFEAYSVFATPQTGICKVVGIGRTHQNDEYGSDTNSKFHDFVDALTDKYGKHTQYDFLRSGALWSSPQEWVWSIYKKERIVAAFWIGSDGSSLPSDIESIALQVKSVNPTSGPYLTLDYEFSNFPTCKAIMGQVDSSAL